MKNKKISKVLKGLKVVSLVAAVGLMVSGCNEEASASCGKGSCGSKSSLKTVSLASCGKGNTSCGKGSCGNASFVEGNTSCGKGSCGNASFVEGNASCGKGSTMGNNV